MTDTTQSTATSSTPEVIAKGDQSSEIASLMSLVKSNIEAQTGLQKQVSEIVSTIASLKKDNPVANAPENSIAPKVADPVDVGAPVTVSNTYVENTQASIVQPSTPSGSDASGLKLENKADEKAEEKKEEKSDMKKSGEYVYEVVKAIRPEVFNKTADEIPNGYQIIKAVEKGYGGKFTNAQDVLTHTLEKMFAGDFERRPVGAY